MKVPLWRRARRRSNVSLHALFNYILKLLYLGCQWKELPIEKDATGRREISMMSTQGPSPPAAANLKIPSTPHPRSENRSENTRDAVPPPVWRRSRAYAQDRYESALGNKSAGDLWLQNESGVIMQRKAKREGLMLSLGSDAVMTKVK